MRRLAQVLFVTSVVVFAVGCSEPHQYDSSAGKFSVEFPGKPEEQSQTVQTEVGSIKLNIVMYEKRNSAYLVMYCDYPADHVQAAGSDVILEGACEGAVSNIRGTLVSQEPITIGDHPGREIKATASTDGNQVELRSRIYLVGNRLYQVIVSATPGGTKDSVANRFVDSFKLN